MHIAWISAVSVCHGKAPPKSRKLLFLRIHVYSEDSEHTLEEKCLSVVRFFEILVFQEFF